MTARVSIERTTFVIWPRWYWCVYWTGAEWGVGGWTLTRWGAQRAAKRAVLTP